MEGKSTFFFHIFFAPLSRPPFSLSLSLSRTFFLVYSKKLSIIFVA